MARIEEAFRLAELLCAKICHELTGLTGTLNGMLDLAAEQHPPAAEPLGFAGEFAAELDNRLKLLRAAYGPDGGPIDVAQFRVLAAALPGHHRITLELSGVPQGAVFDDRTGRVLLNLMLLAADGLPAGGTMTLSGSPRSGITLTITGPRAAWPAGFAAMLADEAAAWAALTSARTLQGPLTALLARGLGLRLSLLKPTARTRMPPPVLLTCG